MSERERERERERDSNKYLVSHCHLYSTPSEQCQIVELSSKSNSLPSSPVLWRRRSCIQLVFTSLSNFYSLFMMFVCIHWSLKQYTSSFILGDRSLLTSLDRRYQWHKAASHINKQNQNLSLSHGSCTCSLHCFDPFPW